MIAFVEGPLADEELMTVFMGLFIEQKHFIKDFSSKKEVNVKLYSDTPRRMVSLRNGGSFYVLTDDGILEHEPWRIPTAVVVRLD